MIRLTGCLGLVFVLSSGASAFATPWRGVRQSDIAATRAYLLAKHELGQAEARDAPASQAAVHELVAHVRSQCPNVLAGAPATKVIGALEWQTLAQVSHASTAPAREAQIAFTKKVKRLRWSNHKLTYYIRGSAEEARANVELAMPNICSEASAIATGGYQTVPPSMAEYERQESAANSKVTIVIHSHEKASGSLEGMILRMLKPYERPDERALIPRRPTNKQLEEAVKNFFSYATEIIHALGLSNSEAPHPDAHPVVTARSQAEALYQHASTLPNACLSGRRLVS